MNLSKLFELQHQLDERIEREHPRQEGEDRMSKKILALQVELGELCNCWRGFKFWSKDQEPRAFERVPCPTCNPNGGGYRLFQDGSEDPQEFCETCAGYKCIDKNPLLEEFADCLHFLLSIGLEREIGTFTGDELMPIKMGTIEIQFITLFKVTVTFLEDINYYQDMWELFLGLGEMLGFTWEQIEESYFEKNRINHERQNNGY